MTNGDEHNKESSMTFKTFHEAADDFFANMPKDMTPQISFYAGAATGLLLLVTAKDNAARDAIEKEIMDFMRKHRGQA